MASSAHAGNIALLPSQGPSNLTAFAGRMVVAGLVNALTFAFLICHLPASNTPTVTSLLIRAVIYVAAASLAGLAGAHLYWTRSEIPAAAKPPLSFSLFARACTAGWVWVPSAVLLSREDSPASAVIAAFGAALIATRLRKIIPSVAGLPPQNPPVNEPDEKELLADSLLTYTRDISGYAIAVCIYVAAYSLITRYFLNAGLPLALAAFWFAWKATLEPDDRRPNNWRDHLKLAVVVLMAVLVTFSTLLYGVDHWSRANAVLGAVDGHSSTNGSKQKGRLSPSAFSLGGYESVILWPVPPKKQFAAPLPPAISPFGDNRSKPLVIQFDGVYWYFQPPGQRPGPEAHQAHGSPTAVDIQANNFAPLTMEAHQNLAAAIRLARCRALQVEIENRDNRPGAIALGVLLANSATPAEPSLYLGEQPILSTQSAHFAEKSSPRDEVLRFAIPANTKLRKFDEITVVVLPDIEHAQIGAKIAIRQFELIPR